MKIKIKASSLKKALQPALVAALTDVKKEHRLGGLVQLSVDDDFFVRANGGNAAVESLFDVATADEFAVAQSGFAVVNAGEIAKTIDSFRPDSLLEVAMGSGGEGETRQLELRLIENGDVSEEVQTVRVREEEMELPAAISAAPAKTFKIRRDVVSMMISKISFAFGFERFQPEFQMWVLRVRDGLARAAAGDGGRFAVYEASGSDVVEGDKNIDVCIHKDQTNVFSKLISASSDQYVEFIIPDSKRSTDYSNQLIVKIGSATLVFAGHDPMTSWPDESVFLDEQHDNILTSRLEEWQWVIKGAMATYSEEMKSQSQAHVSEMVMPSGSSKMKVKTQGTSTSSRTVGVLDQKWDGDPIESFKTYADYLSEMVKVGSPEEVVQIGFKDSTRPAVVRYFASEGISDAPIYRTNFMADTKEQFVVFFAPEE